VVQCGAVCCGLGGGGEVGWGGGVGGVDTYSKCDTADDPGDPGTTAPGCSVAQCGAVWFSVVQCGVAVCACERVCVCVRIIIVCCVRVDEVYNQLCVAA